jgi:hypothetical protein
VLRWALSRLARICAADAMVLLLILFYQAGWLAAAGFGLVVDG